MVNQDDFDVGAALDALLTRSGKQKKLLAEYMGVSEQAVQKWIKQGTIAREHIKKLCQFLGCSADELLGIQPIRESAPLSHSRSVRQDPKIIRGVARAMQDTADELGVRLTIREAVELGAELYDKVGETGITTADVVWLVRRLEQGTGSDAGRSGLSNGPRDVAGTMGGGTGKA
jgi:DNA-binding Xre family transcriptional regulator